MCWWWQRLEWCQCWSLQRSLVIFISIFFRVHQHQFTSLDDTQHHTDHHNSHSENWAGKCMCCLQRILIWTRFSYDKQPGLILFWVHYNNLTTSSNPFLPHNKLHNSTLLYNNLQQFYTHNLGTNDWELIPQFSY